MAAALAVGGGGLVAQGGTVSADDPFPKPVPQARCGKGSNPETDIQGRVPRADYRSGRAAEGYTCNTKELAHEGGSGGFKVLRYTDEQGNTCAFYDNTLIFPRDVVNNLSTGQGTVVLDMSRPRRPVRTTTLDSPAMVSPHETLLVNRKRGLLAAVLGTAATYPGVLDVYDVSQDCRDPQLLSSTLSGVLGHESGWSNDGLTFYSSSTVASLAAIDLADPTDPQVLTTQWGVNYHGMRLSDDGRILYAANIGDVGPTGVTDGGIAILDVSQVQDRVEDPEITILSKLTWPEHSIPQVAEPFTRKGRHYVLEIDEFVDFFEATNALAYPGSPVGVARIIDVEDPTDPEVVSNIRLEVHQPENRGGDQLRDPGAWFPAQGYAGHYCSLPKRRNPKLAGCSMIASGLRLFDIRDVEHPREVGYFNKPLIPGGALKPPTLGGAYAMSAPAYDRRRGQVWYTDTNTGFYNVKLTNGLKKLLR